MKLLQIISKCLEDMSCSHKTFVGFHLRDREQKKSKTTNNKIIQNNCL